jgi:hypothetical protein
MQQVRDLGQHAAIRLPIPKPRPGNALEFQL